MTIAEKALEIAITQLGKSEEPRRSNWGPHVQKYLASVGIKTPAPWCMAFVYWCYGEAAKSMGVKNPLLCTGHVGTQWNMRKANHAVNSPHPGDLFVLLNKDGTGHIGFVRTIAPTGDLATTVEGNSNDEGDREGYEVCSKPGGRKRSTIKGFLRFS